MRTKLSWLLAALCAAAMPGTAFANLLTNGSFEDTTNFVNQGNDTMDLNVGSTAMPGWRVVGSHYVSWIGPTNPFNLSASPGGGRYFLDLTGYIFGPPFSGVAQTFSTIPGANYLLTFELGSSPFWGIQDGVTVTAGSGSGTFTSTNNGAQTNLWQTESLSFKALGPTTTLSIVGASGDNYIGLDDVSVIRGAVPVPEPAVWLTMLVGLGGLGTVMRLRRRVVGAT